MKEPTPAGARIKTPFAGATVKDGVMTLDVPLAAGETKILTAEFEITAMLGETVTFEGGFVGDIPSNSIPIQVGGAKLNADILAKLDKVANREYNQQLRDGGANAYNLADVLYQKVLGLNVRFPNNKTVATKYTKVVETPSKVKTNVFREKSEIAAADMAEFRMIVPTCWGGHNIWGQVRR